MLLSLQRGIVVRSMEHILTTAREDTTGQYVLTLLHAFLSVALFARRRFPPTTAKLRGAII